MDIAEVFQLEVLDFEEDAVRRRVLKVYKERVNPRTIMTDSKFKRHFRFSKENVAKLTDIIEEDLIFPTKRGQPIPPLIQVCITLNHYAGGHFQRISGWCSGVSQNGARLSILRVTDALIRIKPHFVHMSSVECMQETALRMHEKFGLPRFAYAVDGVQLRFVDAPKKLPADKVAQMFWCRKQFYSINGQVVANDRLIYDIDVSWPGSTHDALV